MAADTAAKRLSAVNIGSPWRGVGVVPSGTVDAGERAAAIFLYALAGGAVVVAPTRREELLGSGLYPDPRKKRLPLPQEPDLDNDGVVEEALQSADSAPVPGAGTEETGGGLPVPSQEPLPVPVVDPVVEAELQALRQDLEMAQRAMQEATAPARIQALDVLISQIERRIREIDEEEQFMAALMDI